MIEKLWPLNCIDIGRVEIITQTFSNTRMKSPTILIFDYEEAVRESLRLVLAEEGFQCFTATNESDALHILSSYPIGIAILDTQIPGLSLILETIKTKYPYLKTILLSSYSEFEVTQQALAAGADDYALKPLDFEELIVLIKNIFPIPE